MNYHHIRKPQARAERQEAETETSRKTCSHKKLNGELCQNRISEGEGLCWLHAKSWRHKWRSLTRNQSIMFILAVFGALLAVLAIILWGVDRLKPSVAVEPYATQDRYNPFAEQFYVQNHSLYAVRNVTPLCKVRDVNVAPAHMKNFSIMDMAEIRKDLAPEAKSTVT